MISQVRINTPIFGIDYPDKPGAEVGNGRLCICSRENGKKYTPKNAPSTGRTYGANTEVVSGLQAGDQVISTGYNDLNEGQIISF